MTVPEAVPLGWSVQRGSDIFSFITSGSRGWAKYYADDGALFLRIGNLDKGTVTLDLRDLQRVAPPKGAEGSRTGVVPGDVLVSITADLGSVAVVPTGLGEAYINQHIALARPRDGLNAKYIGWFIASPEGQRQLLSLQRGATKKGLGLDDIRALQIPFAPASEQGWIVAEIEKQFTRLDAGVEALKRLQAHLRRYRAAVLHHATQGTGGSGHADDSWITRGFDEVVDVASDGGRRLAQKDYLASGPIPVVDQGEPDVGGYTEDDGLKYRGELPVVVFGDHTRRFKYVDFPFAVGAQGVKLLRAKPGVLPKYLFYALSAARFEDRGYSRHFQFLRATALRIPSVSEQGKVVAAIERHLIAIETLRHEVQANMVRSSRLRKSVLAAAYSGRLSQEH